jgi:AcrR family transcriptional regulator
VSIVDAPDPRLDNPLFRRVLRAAEELFKKSGFRAVSMEAVARDAAVSKATLYTYFRNKDELFLAVCDRMARHSLRVFRDGLAGEGTLAERVTAAVLARCRIALTLTLTSPHADDLFSHKAQLAGELFAQADEASLADLTAALAADPAVGRRAEELARAAFFGGKGLAAQLTSVAAVEQELPDFVAMLLAGARSLGPTSD